MGHVSLVRIQRRDAVDQDSKVCEYIGTKTIEALAVFKGNMVRHNIRSPVGEFE